jgi:hypothetical protein
MHLESYDYVLCQEAVEETLEHLFSGCNFAKNCWGLIGISIYNQNNVYTIIDQIKAQSHHSFFMLEIILCVGRSGQQEMISFSKGCLQVPF